MASRKLQKTGANLPDDIIANILCKLPRKQVVQMMCMSKFWYNSISEPLFIKYLSEHSIHNNGDIIFLVFHVPFSFKRTPFTAQSITRSPNLELSNLIKLPANKPSDGAWCNVVGSVNGLICFYYFDRTIVINIWNPFLSELLVLSPSNNIPVACEYVLTFGFDPATNDYKVVKIRFHSRVEAKECFLVEVYSMRKGSWKLITEKFPSHVTRIYDDDEVCVHGHQNRIHWLGDLGEKKKQTIVAFDFGLETFSEILLPDSLLYDDIKNISVVLGCKAGKICVMSHVKDNEYEVWVMHEYGVSESWMKHHVYSEFTGNLNPFDDDFLYKAYDHSLSLYKPIAPNDVFLKIVAILLGKTKVLRYVESLCSVRAS